MSDEDARALDRLAASLLPDDEDHGDTLPPRAAPVADTRHSRSRLIRIVGIVLVGFLVGFFMVRWNSSDSMTAAMAQPNAILPTDIHVIDGDTIRLLDRRPDGW